MSFNLGVYTAPSGSTTAFAGQVIASATWNAIFTDISTALGQLSAPLFLASIPVVVSVSNVADTTVTIPIFPGYSWSPVNLYMTGGNSSGAGTTGAASVAMYTAVSAGGTQIVGSHTIIITTSTSGVSTTMQAITSSIQNATVFPGTLTQVFLRTTVAGTGQINAVFTVTPIPL